MSLPGWIGFVENWAASELPRAEWFALAGVAVVVLAALWVFVRALAFAVWFSGAVRNAARARKAKASKSPGFRILLAEPAGWGSKRSGRWLAAALAKHLPVFAFGAPFSIVPMGRIKGGLSPKSVLLARKRMALADADLFVWAARTGRGDRGFEIHGLSRGGGLSAADARLFTVFMPGSKRAQTAEVARIAAYLIAKQMQPALSDPQAFRAEKMRDLALVLDEILASSPGIAAGLRSELEADFCMAGVRAAEELGDLDALDKVIALRRRHVEAAEMAADTGRMIQARMDLGRALIVRAEKRFDQHTVKEAIAQLSQAVEGLRSDPAIQRAQAASDALFKAQTMIETRKRFALNFGA